MKKLTLILALLVALLPLLAFAEEPVSTDAEALYQLGISYLEGENPDYEAARANLEQAAGLGHAQAMNSIGVNYNNGNFNGGTPDYAKAEEWYLKAAELGFDNAMYNLGVGYNNGNFNGGTPDYAKAEEWYLKAAELGFDSATYNLGVNYENGNFNGGTPDLTKAEEWYLKAAELGHVNAMYNLGNGYKPGNFNGGEPSGETALSYYMQAWNAGYTAAENPIIDLLYYGITAEDGTVLFEADHGRMLEFLNEMYQKGTDNAYALSWLGWLLCGNSEQDVFEADYPRALEVYTCGAELGSGYCMLQVGLIYEADQLGEADLTAAEKWFANAVEAGEPAAREALDRVRNAQAQ